MKRIIEKNKKGKETDKGWTCDLVPKQLVLDHYFTNEQVAIQEIETQIESIQATVTSHEEEHATEGGLLEDAANDKGKITKATLTKRLKEIKGDTAEKEAYNLMQEIAKLFDKEAQLKKQLKTMATVLEKNLLNKYAELTEQEVRNLVIDHKWIASLNNSIQTEIDAISQRLTGRIKELAERYQNTMGQLDEQAEALETKVSTHLKKMGLVWSK